MKTFKVALVQKSAVANDSNENLKLAMRFVEHCSEIGADIVLFPEMWSNGYAPPFDGAFDNPYDPAFESERNEWLDSAIATDSAYVDSLKSVAKRFGIGVVATYLSKTETKPQNTAILINRAGEVVLEYSKVHTCDFSLEGLLQSGNEFKVCTFDGTKIGVMICFDREFPESARVLMLKGAELILVPNACDMNSARIQQLSTRAFENMVGVAMANYPGKGWGNSCAFSPIVFDELGNCQENKLAMADDIASEILLAEFDMDAIRRYRQKEPWGNAFRKTCAYGELTAEEKRK